MYDANIVLLLCLFINHQHCPREGRLKVPQDSPGVSDSRRRVFRPLVRLPALHGNVLPLPGPHINLHTHTKSKPNQSLSPPTIITTISHLSWAPDLHAPRLQHHLPPMRQPTDHPRHREQHREEVQRETHRPVDQPAAKRRQNVPFDAIFFPSPLITAMAHLLRARYRPSATHDSDI